MLGEAYLEHMPFVHATIRTGFVQERLPKIRAIARLVFRADPHHLGDRILFFGAKNHRYLVNCNIIYQTVRIGE